MSNREKEMWKESSPIGYWSAIGGVEVKTILYGIDDYVVCVSNAWYGHKSVHKVKIRYNAKGDDYVIVAGRRLYLKDCIRV